MTLVLFGVEFGFWGPGTSYVLVLTWFFYGPIQYHSVPNMAIRLVEWY